MGTGLSSLLIANRGEIAIRIVRAAAEHGLRTVTVHSEDDAAALHTRKSDETRALRGSGPAAYLDAEQIVAVARAAGCDAIHPGYGFLSESSAFARRCAAEGLVFVGPAPQALDVFGDKTRTRALAQRVGVPVLAGTTGPTSLDEARVFLAAQGAGTGIMLKAIAGGGGRGMRPVQGADDLEAAYARCRSEALQSFGNGDVYAERLFPRARHIEVQVAGDRSGGVTHFWERECSIQRQRQKLIEIAPAPGLGSARAGADLRGGRGARPRGGPRQSGHGGIPRRRRRRRGRGLRLHRGQSSPAGGAHGDGGGDRARPRPAAVRAGRGADAGRARAGPGRGAQAARDGDAGAHQHGDDGVRRDRAPGGRDAHRLRAAVGAGHPRRHVRICRLPDQPAVRFAARQADRLLVLGHPDGRGRQGVPRALRAQDRGRADQCPVPPEPAASSGAPGRSASHGLRRGARGRAARAGRVGPPAPVLRAGGLVAAPRRPGRSRRPARGSRPGQERARLVGRRGGGRPGGAGRRRGRGRDESAREHDPGPRPPCRARSSA